MLTTLWAARIPIFGISTNDVICIDEVIEYILGEKVVPLESEALPSKLKSKSPVCRWLVMDGGESFSVSDLADLYKQAAEHNHQVIIVNPKAEISPFLAHAGRVQVPDSLLGAVIPELVDKKAALRSLSGLSLKDAAEVAAVAKDGPWESFADRVLKARSMVRNSVLGVTRVDSDSDFYAPDKALEQWCNIAQNFLRHENSHLQPRGLLLSGDPGVGKTEGARYVARCLGVTLYRLDIAGLMNKFVGQSERNLAHALEFLQQEAPCVILMDEVEKLFHSGEDEGVSNNLLGQMLWWLQEHVAPTVTIMTTNDEKKIPPELFRAGRIDKMLVLEKMTSLPEVKMFLDFFISGALKIGGAASPILASRATDRLEQQLPVSHGEAVNAAIYEVRIHLMKGE